MRLLLLLGQASLVAFAWLQSFELLVAAVGLIVAFGRFGGSLRAWRVRYDYSLVLLKESWPLILAGLSVVLYMKIDVVMLGKMSDDREVGLYSAASRLSEAFYFLPMIIVSSLNPLLLRARASGAEQYRKSLLKLYVLMVRLSLAIALPLLILAPLLIETLYGIQYSESTAVLQVHVWAAVAVFLGVASSQYFTAEGKQKLSLYRTLLGLAVNIGMNFLLIPRYGALGAAVATLVSYFVATFSVFFTRDGVSQARLMVRALNPIVILGLVPAR
jgi:PST family polysaccharide transporter